MRPLLLLLVFLMLAGAWANAKVLVVSGMSSEGKIALGNSNVVSVLSGGSLDVLNSRLAVIDPSQIQAVVSFGVAGGLNPYVRAGDVVLADSVLTDAGVSFFTDTKL